MTARVFSSGGRRRDLRALDRSRGGFFEALATDPGHQPPMVPVLGARCVGDAEVCPVATVGFENSSGRSTLAAVESRPVDFAPHVLDAGRGSRSDRPTAA